MRLTIVSFLTLIFKNLQRRRSRSILTTIGIAIGIAAVVALTSLAWGFERSWAKVYEAHGADLVITKANTHSAMPSPFSSKIKAEIQAMPHVHEVAGLFCEIFSVEDSPSLIVAGWEPGTGTWTHLNLIKGGLPRADAQRQAVMGVVAAESLRKSVGDRIQIETIEFTICGIFSSSAFAENGAIILPLADMQRLMDQEGMVNFFDVRLDSNTSEEAVESLRRVIAEKFKGLTAFSPGAVAQSTAGIQIAKAMSVATSLIALAVGAVGVMNTILMSVFERIQEIGVLLAIGWKRVRILKMILLESIVLSLIGGIAGCLLGLLAVSILQASPWIRGKIDSEISPSLLGLSMVVALALGALGGLYPAWIGSRMSPASALRH